MITGSWPCIVTYSGQPLTLIRLLASHSVILTLGKRPLEVCDSNA